MNSLSPSAIRAFGGRSSSTAPENRCFVAPNRQKISFSETGFYEKRTSFHIFLLNWRFSVFRIHQNSDSRDSVKIWKFCFWDFFCEIKEEKTNLPAKVRFDERHLPENVGIFKCRESNISFKFSWALLVTPPWLRPAQITFIISLQSLSRSRSENSSFFRAWIRSSISYRR